jgi:hypothetical protein
MRCHNGSHMAQTPGRPASFPQNQRRDECCSDRKGRVTKRQSGSCPSITISAFLGTNPADETITSGLPVIRPR